jgi:hypothetical protein
MEELPSLPSSEEGWQQQQSQQQQDALAVAIGEAAIVVRTMKKMFFYLGDL